MSRARWLVPAALALALAGCSAGSSGTGEGTTSAPSPSAAPSAAAQPAGGDRPAGGVSGLIAYVSGDLMQVQGGDMQTAVTWTADTAITAEVPATVADVAPGLCVTATVEGATDSSDSAVDPAAGAATSVAITDPVDGECGLGFAVGGARADVAPGDLPTDLPTDLPGGRAGGTEPDEPRPGPSGAPDPDGAGGGATWGRALGVRSAGLVTAVDGSTITLETTGPDGTTTTTVTVDAATAYSKAAAADASALVVGQCVAARGDADTSGKVVATSLAVSAPVDGACAPAFGSGGLGGVRTGAGPSQTQEGGDA